LGQRLELPQPALAQVGPKKIIWHAKIKRHAGTPSGKVHRHKRGNSKVQQTAFREGIYGNSLWHLFLWSREYLYGLALCI
jgi:hypothetical protein